MRAVLGIDAAWTLTQASGVAVAVKDANGWRVLAAAPSYQHFHALAGDDPVFSDQAIGARPDASALLASTRTLCGRAVDLVAIDMPLARVPIVGRRAADNVVSKVYGGRKCATHSPSELRPGRISDDLRQGFERAGYPLLTRQASPPGLIEVYPHPALVELAGASERLPYKASKMAKYWPVVSPVERRVRLYRQWAEIVTMLEDKITGVVAALPKLDLNASVRMMKSYEDTLDAIICAWIATCVLDGRAMPLGDDVSAIWVPTSK